MADSIDLDDDDPSTTGSRVICHVCRRLVSLKRDGTFRVHGPRDRRCQGSSLLPAEQTRASLPFSPNTTTSSNCTGFHPSTATSPVLSGSFECDKFEEAFGAVLTKEQIDINTPWYSLWNGIIRLNGKQFDLPGGAVGRAFVELLTTEIGMITRGEEKSERLMCLTPLLLQRDPMIKKGCDIRRTLEKRMEMWRAGHFEALLHEAQRCDAALCGRRYRHDDENSARVFTRLMLRGKVREAVRLITERTTGGILRTDDIVEGTGKTVLEILKEKHPSPTKPDPSAFAHCAPLPPLIDVDITALHVEHVAHKIKGGAGPSGTDSVQWQSFLLCYGAHSNRLREAIAALTRLMANTVLEWDNIKALMANRLIALDKCPGVRPIGIGECLRRIIGRVMALTTGTDVEMLCGTDQLASGLKAGIEGAVHAMMELYTQHSGNGWRLLLVDAKNAFNMVNRVAALWNARVLWPRCSRFLFNTYRGFARLVLRGSDECLFSKEGVTQGDPLSMLIYAVALLPLVKSLKVKENRLQTWYADDSACIGNIKEVRSWYDQLAEQGPAYGYFPEPKKSCLIVTPQFEDEARIVFGDLGVQIVNGHRFLGGVIGDCMIADDFVRKKVAMWVDCVVKLSKAATKSPQAAYTALSKSLQCEWSYLQRVMHNCGGAFVPLQDAILKAFYPALFEGDLSDAECKLFSLPTRFAGLGINNPTETASSSYHTSTQGTKVVVEAIKGCGEFSSACHLDAISKARYETRKALDEVSKQKLDAILATLSPGRQRAIMRVVEGKTSSWLTTLPLQSCHFDLAPVQFRDGLALRYLRHPSNLPAKCDGCGADFTLQHALDCKKGGLVILRHNEIRDCLGDLASQVWPQVIKEPIVNEATATSSDPGLRLDLGIRGVWQPQVEALFDVRVIDTDAPSHCHRAPNAILESSSLEKKRMYKKAVEDRRGTFTPFVLSVDGLLHKEASHFLKHMATALSSKWDKTYSITSSYVRSRLAFAGVRAVSLCLRGSRTKWRSGLGFEDGAPLASFME